MIRFRVHFRFMFITRFMVKVGVRVRAQDRTSVICDLGLVLRLGGGLWLGLVLVLGL
jgi:hypothetical protein